MSRDLFQQIANESNIHPSFKGMSSSLGHRGARRLMNEYFNQMPKPDENFVEQFQTTGFDARTFELGLYACFSFLGYKVDRTHAAPDFILSKYGNEVALGAVTSSPREPLRFKNTAPYIKPLNDEEIQKKILDEVPIRLGSPLFSKLKKKYWELPHCVGKPLVLAIQAFHEPGSLFYTDAGLQNYLFGTRHFPVRDESGCLLIDVKEVKAHRLEDKVIPSHFFGQPDTENVSAILFSNSLTVSKFTRMAYLKGYNKKVLSIKRSGHFFIPDPNVAIPGQYEYFLDDPSAPVETWPQGLVLILNPYAKYPMPDKFSEGITTSVMENGEHMTSFFGFHPYTSVTKVYVDHSKMTE